MLAAPRTNMRVYSGDFGVQDLLDRDMKWVVHAARGRRLLLGIALRSVGWAEPNKVPCRTCGTLQAGQGRGRAFRQPPP